MINEINQSPPLLYEAKTEQHVFWWCCKKGKTHESRFSLNDYLEEYFYFAAPRFQYAYLLQLIQHR